MFELADANRLLDSSLEEAKKLFLSVDYYYDGQELQIMSMNHAGWQVADTNVTSENAPALLMAITRRLSDDFTFYTPGEKTKRELAFRLLWLYLEHELDSQNPQFLSMETERHESFEAARRMNDEQVDREAWKAGHDALNMESSE